MIYVIVGLAGVLGALLRYGVGLGFAACWQAPSFWATLSINLTGCLLLGWFNSYMERHPQLHPWWRAGFGTGFIGAYTTFSTFSNEMFMMLRSGEVVMALVYSMSSLWGGLAMAWLGYRIVSWLPQRKVG